PEHALRGRNPKEVRPVVRAGGEVDQSGDRGRQVGGGERQRERFPRLPRRPVHGVDRDEERRGDPEGDRVGDRVGHATEPAGGSGAATREDPIQPIEPDRADDEEHRPERVAREDVEDRSDPEDPVRERREVRARPPAVGHAGVSRAIELAPARTRSPTFTTGLARSAGTSTSTRDPSTIIPSRSPFFPSEPTRTKETRRRATTPVICTTSTGPRTVE